MERLHFWHVLLLAKKVLVNEITSRLTEIVNTMFWEYFFTDWVAERFGNISLSVNNYTCSMLQLTSGISSTANSYFLQITDSPQNICAL